MDFTDNKRQLIDKGFIIFVESFSKIKSFLFCPASNDKNVDRRMTFQGIIPL